ncbi:MAG: oxidoreductase [Methanoregula sp.]|nr:oxidoreductase [Methanoregula sp.]
MPECTNPLWSCAMTGAASCLAGFRGLSVVIHGSSGCYYYPATLLHAPLHGTFIMENDVIFGSEERLNEVIHSLSGNGTRIAVITTCVPSILGEDIRSMLAAHDVILVDSPGFSGDVEAGYHIALSTLAPSVDPDSTGVNIEGASLFDPFARGNVQECSRLLDIAGVPKGTIFSQDALRNVWQAAPYTIGTNEDFPSGVGTYLGGTLGLSETQTTFEHIAEVYDGADIEPVCREIAEEEERVIYACDKYLRRYDPPTVAIFAGASYAQFAAEVLNRYLDAGILFVGTRNEPSPVSRYPTARIAGLSEARACIEQHTPDLVIGSSFERSVCNGRAFVGITPPLRSRVRLVHQPLAGIGGTLHFTEEVLNACMDRKPATH